jgi:glutamine amidotransferase
MICIVDYGLGNLGSIRNMLKKVGFPSVVSSSADEIRAAQKLILPGVGAFDAGMRNLNDSGLVPALEEKVLAGNTPILGICLGMQLMTKSSEEGQLPGLGWIDAHTRLFAFPEGEKLPVPHMGWREVTAQKPDILTKDMDSDARFYFVHSYRVMCEDVSDELYSARYGIKFTAAFARGNIRGVQFHPEKSHKFGMALLRNFAEH